MHELQIKCASCKLKMGRKKIRQELKKLEFELKIKVQAGNLDFISIFLAWFLFDLCKDFPNATPTNEVWNKVGKEHFLKLFDKFSVMMPYASSERRHKLKVLELKIKSKNVFYNNKIKIKNSKSFNYIQ